MKPVLVLTDDGRDVDDIEAITYIQGSPNTYIAGIVTTHIIPDRRAFIARTIMNSFNETKVPIGVGSIYPIGKEDELLIPYLRSHTIKNKTYEGDGLIECFPDGIELIHELIKKHGHDLSIAVLAPLTDLAKAIQSNEKDFCKIKGLYIQGQATVKNDLLIPDPQAYNISADPKAADIVFGLQDKINFTLVGKYAAYEIPLTRNDFQKFNDTGHPVGKYLKIHAEKGLECFVKRAPSVFKKVFNIPEEQDANEALAHLNKLSNPYDAMVAMSIAKPELFNYETIGNHKLIGQTKDNTGLKSKTKIKKDLMTTMLHALTK